MFALALGIDYALFLVVRFRAALHRRGAAPGDRAAAVDAVAETVATAGKAVAFSALTVLASLAAILLVPSPAFRSMALGIMLSVVAVLAATLTLLPAVLGKLGTKIDSGRIRLHRTATPRQQPHGHRLEQRLHAWGRTMWRHPYIAATRRPHRPRARRRAGDRATHVNAVHHHHPRLGQRPGRLLPGHQRLRPRRPRHPPSRRPRRRPARRPVRPGPHHRCRRRGPRARPTPATPSTRSCRPPDPPPPPPAATIDRIRHTLPAGSLVGGAAAENFDLQHALASRTPLVFGILAAMGFLLLLIALGAPLIAAAGVAVTALSVAGAFGIARLIFQDGHLAGILHFTPQGFVDAWGPLFFGAMVFGVAMDYTLFLLSAAKERYETHPDPEHAMIGSVGTSGRVVISAAAVMIAVFLTFALSGPLAPKEMGVILAVAVALDALIVRMVLLPVILRLGGHKAWHRPPGSTGSSPTSDSPTDRGAHTLMTAPDRQPLRPPTLAHQGG